MTRQRPRLADLIPRAPDEPSLSTAIEQAAVHSGKEQGLVSDAVIVVGVLMTADGRWVMQDGKPVVASVPLVPARITDGVVEWHRSEQLISPKDAARIAGVHKATVERAVLAGELPPPFNVSSRRVGHRLSDVAAWAMRDRQAPPKKK